MERGELSRGRKLTAALGMLGSSASFAWLAYDGMRPSWLMVAFTAMLAGSGVALTRGSVLTQILARGVAWLAMFPTLVYFVGCAIFGRAPEMEVVALGLSTGLALLAARPSLTTPSARADFAPNAWRRLFLTGGTITAGTALALGGGGIAEMTHHSGSALVGLGLTAVAASMLGSVVGVMKMRGWGVLLGGLTSLGLFAAAALGPRHAGFGLSVLALPTLLGFIAPIVLARLGLAPAPPPVTATSPIRIAFDDAPQVRIGSDASLEDDAELLDAPRPAAALRV